MGSQIIETAGLLVKHILGVLLLCWRRMARAALISFVVGFVLVEIAGSVALGHFPAPVVAQVVALVFALVAAYAVALTVMIDQLIIGSIDIIRVLEGDVQAGAAAMALAAERRAGEAGSGIMRWLGQPRSVPPELAEQRRQTQADIDATDVFLSTAPRPRVNARPVQAKQLPRITWAMEQLEKTPEWATVTVAAPTAPIAADPDSDMEASAPLPVTPPPPPAPSPRVTRPITRPLVAEAEPTVEGQRSIWSRISKTLVGSVHPPLDDEGDEAQSNEEV